MSPRALLLALAVLLASSAVLGDERQVGPHFNPNAASTPVPEPDTTTTTTADTLSGAVIGAPPRQWRGSVGEARLRRRKCPLGQLWDRGVCRSSSRATSRRTTPRPANPARPTAESVGSLRQNRDNAMFGDDLDY